MGGAQEIESSGLFGREAAELPRRCQRSPRPSTSTHPLAQTRSLHPRVDVQGPLPKRRACSSSPLPSSRGRDFFGASRRSSDASTPPGGEASELLTALPIWRLFYTSPMRLLHLTLLLATAILFACEAPTSAPAPMPTPSSEPAPASEPTASKRTPPSEPPSEPALKPASAGDDRCPPGQFFVHGGCHTADSVGVAGPSH